MKGGERGIEVVLQGEKIGRGQEELKDVKRGTQRERKKG